MPISMRYVSRETATNLWRNRLMAVAAILTVSVSLSLVGTALLLRQAVNNSLNALQANVNLEIFVEASAGAAQTAPIRTLIHETPQIRKCNYLDHEQSYRQAVALFKQEGDPTAEQVLTPATTPPVFQCTLVHPGDAATVATLFTSEPKVFRVEYPGKSIHQLQTLSNRVQVVLLVLALVLLLSSIVLILNAIRMAIFARRREVGVMRLVGATAWFIRLPFMMEGFVQGVVGAAFAVGMVLLGDAGIKALFPQFKGTAVPSHDVVITELFVVLVGVIVGMGGSALAVRRFLEV
jgi:cell division transport system permease protein